MELILLVGLIVVGAMLTRFNILVKGHITWINKWIINIALPAVALAKIPGIDFSFDLLAPIFTPLIGFAGAGILFYHFLKRKYSASERLVMTVLGGLGNTSFLGFPLVVFYLGTDHLGGAVIFDQMGFLLVATVVQWLILRNDQDYKFSDSLMRVFRFPAFVGLIVAIWLPEEFLGGVTIEILDMIIWTISPLAMLIIGYQINRFITFTIDPPAILSITYRLMIFPAFVVLIFSIASFEGQIASTSILESGMGPMITPALLLMDKDIENRLSAQILCWGTLFSFVTTYLWVIVMNT